MKNLSIQLGVLLIVALLLTEAHSLLYRLNPKLADRELNLFIKKHSFPLSLEWYVKQTMDSFYIIILSFVGAKASYQYSFKLYCIFSICFMYGLFDLFMFWYNYKDIHTMFWGIVIAASLSIFLLIVPIKNWKGKYKSLE
jgi:hypothetical protein